MKGLTLGPKVVLYLLDIKAKKGSNVAKAGIKVNFVNVLDF